MPARPKASARNNIVLDIEILRSFKRKRLQGVAKAHGVRANMKSEEIIKELLERLGQGVRRESAVEEQQNAEARHRRLTPAQMDIRRRILARNERDIAELNAANAIREASIQERKRREEAEQQQSSTQDE